jgi:DNA-directed RNA polymerase alpha subunit
MAPGFTENVVGSAKAVPLMRDMSMPTANALRRILAIISTPFIYIKK